MRYYRHIIVLFLATCIEIWGCQPMKQVAGNTGKPLPETFRDSRDTTNSATVNWQQFFNDTRLTDIIDTALKNNWDVSIALQRIKIAQSDVLLSKGALRPVVNAMAAASLRKFGLYTMDGAGNITTPIYNNQIVPIDLPDYFVGLQTTWEIDIWGKLRNRKKAAFSRFLASMEGKNIVITNLIADIAVTYYELLALDNGLEIINETIALQENALEVVKVQKEVGTANLLAVEQFEAQLLNLKSMQLDVMQQISENENKINLLAGRYPQPVIRSKSFIEILPTQILTGIPSALLQNRPDIRQSELELMAAKADVKAAKAAFYPSLSITGSMGFQAFKPGLLFTTPESIAYGLFSNLTAPLVNRSAIKAEFNRANAAQLESLYNYQKSIANGYTEVYNEMLRIKNLQGIYDLKTSQVQTLTHSIETSSELFKTGRASYLEVLITQQNALQSKLELINTRKNQFHSTINIYKALGGGWR